MNREIKFRAWDSIAGQMWEDVYFDGGHIYTIGPDGENASTMPRWGDNALMQFTGLKDKNGKEIYEGDIVNVGEIPELQNIIIKDIRLMIDILYHHKNRKVWLEIIGNIHENKDLLT